MTLINKVGLEAEFFLTNKKGELLFPGKNGFSTDEFIILGEFRAEAGSTRVETVSNFMKEWYTINEMAKKKGKVIDINPYKEVDMDFWSTILKTMGTKEISQSKNIYNLDITKDSDAIINRGKIIGHRLSIGLHIHFSSYVHCQTEYTTEDGYHYNQVNLPIKFGDVGLPETTMTLYNRSSKKEPETRYVSADASRITKPVLYNFVEGLDEELFPKYKPDIRLKFRQPGFYELKYHGGFEYRSLPFSQAILDDIYDVVDYCYSLLENLDL